MRVIITEKQLKLINEGIFDFFKKKEIIKRDILVINPNLWTHASFNLQNEINNNKLIMNKENINDFVSDPNQQTVDKFRRPNTNTNAPYFQKGDIFPGFENTKFMITTTLPDTAFVPNRNRTNMTTLSNNGGSSGTAVLKPEYRDINNFSFWSRDDNFEHTGDKNYYKINI